MFDLGWGKIVIIAVIALVVIGPKELPAVLRTVGQWMGKIRRMAAEFQGQFQEAMREAEMADLKKSIDAITDATRGIGTGFDPLGSVTKDIETAFADKPQDSAAGEAPAVEPPVPVEPPLPIEPVPAPPPVAEVAGPEETGAAVPTPAPPPANDAGGRAA